MEAQFFIKKVPGNFHLSTHSSREQPLQVNMRHVIHRLEFGEDSLAGSHLKGSFDPLRDIDKTEVPGTEGWGKRLAYFIWAPLPPPADHTHDYYMKIVPTSYLPYRGSKITGYQYTFAYKVGWENHCEWVIPLAPPLSCPASTEPHLMGPPQNPSR